MKKILNYIWSYCEAFGQAKSAMVLSRMGKHKEAAALMTGRKNELV